MKIITGDLFEQTHLDAIGHGVNCKGVMGAGIAAQFKKRIRRCIVNTRNYARIRLYMLASALHGSTRMATATISHISIIWQASTSQVPMRAMNG